MSDTPSEQFRATYDASTTGCGCVPLVRWSVVSLAGEDRVKFLHNMCTNDIQRLVPGECCEAFCTDVKGKIIAHSVVLMLENRIELLGVPGQAEQGIAHLDRYIIREDVKLEDKSDENAWSLVFGDKSGQILNTELTAFRTKVLDCESYLVRAPRSEIEPLLPGVCVCRDDSVWNALRIEASFPLYGTDFDDAHLPQEIARDDLAISFNKGCYLGQETVARIDALGHVNKRLCTLRFAKGDVPNAGTKLLSGEQEVGAVTSACWSPRDEAPLALAMIRRGSNSAGSKLDSAYGKATVL